jgi:hypothetical protein
MALIEPGDRPHVICRKCKTPVVWQWEMTNEDKAALALETRSNSIAGVQMARARFGLDIREAKALSFHITKVKGECHRCHTPVVEEVSVCEKCRSANLDW